MWREFIQQCDPRGTFLAPATPAMIAEVESALRIALPDDFKSLLGETNGVRLSQGQWLIWSVEHMLEKNLDFRGNPLYRDMYMPFDSLVLFAEAGNGDLFAFPVLANGHIRDSHVYRWHQVDDSRTWAAENVRRFLQGWFDNTLGS